MDVFTAQDLFGAALEHPDIITTTDEAEIGPDGRFKRTVVYSVTTGISGGRRAAGGSVNRVRYVNAICVAPSRETCLWLTQWVQERLTDLSLGSPHGRLTDASYDGDPVPEPDTSPARWSRALAFTITTKRSH